MICRFCPVRPLRAKRCASWSKGSFFKNSSQRSCWRRAGLGINGRTLAAQITFCPTGGVTPENAKTYLALPNTRCVGGSWIAPKALIDAGDWEQITQIARRAADLLE